MCVYLYIYIYRDIEKESRTDIISVGVYEDAELYCVHMLIALNARLSTATRSLSFWFHSRYTVSHGCRAGYTYTVLYLAG